MKVKELAALAAKEAGVSARQAEVVISVVSDRLADGAQPCTEDKSRRTVGVVHPVAVSLLENGLARARRQKRKSKSKPKKK